MEGHAAEKERLANLKDVVGGRFDEKLFRNLKISLYNVIFLLFFLFVLKKVRKFATNQAGYVVAGRVKTSMES